MPRTPGHPCCCNLPRGALDILPPVPRGEDLRWHGPVAEWLGPLFDHFHKGFTHIPPRSVTNLFKDNLMKHYITMDICIRKGSIMIWAFPRIGGLSKPMVVSILTSSIFGWFGAHPCFRNRSKSRTRKWEHVLIIPEAWPFEPCFSKGQLTKTYGRTANASNTENQLNEHPREPPSKSLERWSWSDWGWQTTSHSLVPKGQTPHLRIIPPGWQ
jgi:hypothetical protein